MTALSAENKYLLNRYFGSAGAKTALGDLLEDALTVAIGEVTAITEAYMFVGNGSGVATAVAISGDLTVVADGTMTIADEAVTEAKIEAEGSNGLGVVRRVRAEFDHTDQPLDGAFTLLSSTDIPDNAIIVNAFIDVTETFTSDDTTPDDTSIGVGVETVGAGSEDLVNAAKILTATDWDAGIKQCIPDVATVGDYVKTTAAKDITVNVVNGAGVSTGLTAGHFVLFVDYVVSA